MARAGLLHRLDARRALPLPGARVMNQETPIMNAIRVRLGAAGCALFRNLVGTFRTHAGDPVRCGLGPGSSDLVGWTRVTVTPAMVGRPLAVFTAVEVKVPGAHTAPDRLAAQTRFIDAVLRDGGLAGFADSPDAAQRIINGR